MCLPSPEIRASAAGSLKRQSLGRESGSPDQIASVGNDCGGARGDDAERTSNQRRSRQGRCRMALELAFDRRSNRVLASRLNPGEAIDSDRDVAILTNLGVKLHADRKARAVSSELSRASARSYGSSCPASGVGAVASSSPVYANLDQTHQGGDVARNAGHELLQHRGGGPVRWGHSAGAASRRCAAWRRAPGPLLS
jgi:hypothetical protein